MPTEATDPFAGLAAAEALPTTAPAVGPPPSDKQVRFYRDLLLKKAGEDKEAQDKRIAKKQANGVWTKRRISECIDTLLGIPDKPQEELPVGSYVKLEDGVYRTTDGRTVVVYHTVHGANQQVAKELRAWLTGDTRKDGKPEWAHEFEYLGKAGLKDLTPERHLTEAEARELGIQYGFCVNCGKTLTRNESQYVGYGSTCARNNSWWYPSKKELAALLAGDEAKTTNTNTNRKDEGQ